MMMTIHEQKKRIDSGSSLQLPCFEADTDCCLILYVYWVQLRKQDHKLTEKQFPTVEGGESGDWLVVDFGE